MDVGDRFSQKPYESLTDANSFVSPKLTNEGRVFLNFCKKLSVTFNQIQALFTQGWVNDNTIKKRLNHNIELLTEDIGKINNQAKEVNTESINDLMEDIDYWTDKIGDMKNACVLLQKSGSTSAKGTYNLLDSLEAKLIEQKEALNQKVSAQRNKISTATDNRFLDAEKDLQNAQAEIAKTKSQLKDNESLIQELTAEREKLIEQKVENEKNIKFFADDSQKKIAENEQIKGLLNELQEKLSEAKQKSEESQILINQYEEHLKIAEAKTSKDSSLIENLGNQYAQAVKEKQIAESKIKTLEQEANALRNPTKENFAKVSDQSKEEIENLKNQLNIAQSEIASIKKEANDKSQTQISELSKKQAEIEILKTQLDDKVKLFETLQNLHTNVTTDYLALKDKDSANINKLQEELKRVTDKHTKSQSDISNLEKKLKDAEALTSQDSALIKGLEKQYANAVKEKQAAELRIKTLEQELDEVRSTNQKEIQKQKNELDEVNKKLEVAEANLKANEAKLQNAEDKYDEALEIYENRKNEISKELQDLRTGERVKQIRDVEIPAKIEEIAKASLKSQNTIKEILKNDIVSLINNVYNVEGFEASLGQYWNHLGMANQSADNIKLRNLQIEIQNKIEGFDPGELKEAFEAADELIKNGFKQIQQAIPDDIQGQLNSIHKKIEALNALEQTGPVLDAEVENEIIAFNKAKLEAQKQKSNLATKLSDSVFGVFDKLTEYREQNKLGPDKLLDNGKENFFSLLQMVNNTDDIEQLLERNIDRIIGDSIKFINHVKANYSSQEYGESLDLVEAQSHQLLGMVRPPEDLNVPIGQKEVEKQKNAMKSIEPTNVSLISTDSEEEKARIILSVGLRLLINDVLSDDKFREALQEDIGIPGYPHFADLDELKFLREFTTFKNENDMQIVNDKINQIINIIIKTYEDNNIPINLEILKKIQAINTRDTEIILKNVPLDLENDEREIIQKAIKHSLEEAKKREGIEKK
jgi:hypothetical protein